MTGRHRRLDDTVVTEANVLYILGNGRTEACRGAWSWVLADPLAVTLTVWPADVAPVMRQIARERLAAGLIGDFHKGQPLCVNWARGSLTVGLPLGRWVRVSADLTEDFLGQTYAAASDCPFPVTCEDRLCVECEWCRLAVEAQLREFGLVQS